LILIKSLQEYSRKRNCWGQCWLRAFRIRKTEQIYGNAYIKEQMERDIFEFIEIWYNRKEGIQL
jgi:hypothetical protein